MLQTPTEDSTGKIQGQAGDGVEIRTGLQAGALQQAILDHLRYSIGRPASVLTPAHYYRALALAVRDRVQQRWISSTHASYVDCQQQVSAAWQDTDAWTRMSILNTAGSGKFSSDRAIAEYCDDIWDVASVTVRVQRAATH